jgi:CDP-diacylglycerol--inositol 3-phosphatidyltransferase
MPASLYLIAEFSSLLTGSESHKSIKKEGNYIIYLYYTSRAVLFWVCAFNELFYILLYCYHHQTLTNVSFKAGSAPVNVAAILLIISAPIWTFKQVVNVIQMIGAAKNLASLDCKPKKP